MSSHDDGDQRERISLPPIHEILGGALLHPLAVYLPSYSRPDVLQQPVTERTPAPSQSPEYEPSFPVRASATTKNVSNVTMYL